METMNIENKVIELIKLEYANNDNFYMPVTSISSIQRYIGNTSLNTKLSQLGSDRWIKIKQRAKRKIEDIAAVILLTQAKRELNKGYKFEFNKWYINLPQAARSLYNLKKSNERLRSMLRRRKS